MKKSCRILTVFLAAAAVIAVCVFAIAADEEEYMGSDLPVSESYVLRAIRALDEKFTGKIDSLANEFEKIRAELDKKASADTGTQPTETQPTEPVGAEPVGANTAYEVISLKKGQLLLGNCEMILRSGRASAVCPGANGISDLTAGADLPNETALTANHLLVIPRDDGRGLCALSDTVYVMVRGVYRIEG